MGYYYTRDFEKQFKKLPDRVTKLAIKREQIFRNNNHDPRLKTHRLTGKFAGYWAFSINYQYRIIFKYVKEDIWFMDVGTHEIYKD